MSGVKRQFAQMLGIGKSATDRAAEPSFSPLAPIDYTDDSLVTEVLKVALGIADILLAGGESAADTALKAKAAAAAYGLEHTLVEITLNCITISASRGDHLPPVSVFRLVHSRSLDFTRVARADRLLEFIARGLMPAPAARAEIIAIASAPHPYSWWISTTGWAGLAAAVVVQLGGHPLVVAVSFATTILIFISTSWLGRHELPPFFQQMVGGTIAGLSATSTYTLAANMDTNIRPSQLIAASIIVLLSGLNLVGSVEDAITGYPLTAAARGIEVLMLTGGVIGGLTIGFELAGAFGLDLPSQAPETLLAWQSPVVATIAAGVASGAFAVGCYAGPRTVALSVVAGALGMIIFGSVISTGLGAVFGAGLAALSIGITGGTLARIALVPPLVVSVAGITPMLPGLSVYRGLYSLLNEQAANGISAMASAIGISVALAAGVVFGEWLTRSLRRRKVRR